MNREEAIKLLQMYEINKQGEAELHTWYSGIDNDMREAIDMAISALKGGDAEMNETKSPYMQQTPSEDGSDLISRADVICEVLVNDGIDNIVDRINALPSVSFDGDITEVVVFGDKFEKVVRCKDCEYRNWETRGCNANPCVEEWQEDDFCSRAKMKGGK